MSSALKWYRCAACGSRFPIGQGEAIALLRQVGMLRRDPDPDPEIVQELFNSHLEQFPCSACKGLGIVPTDPPAAPEDELDWPELKTCEECGKGIDPERIELLPKCKVCADCQSKIDEGKAEGEVDYCPRCGTPMQLRVTGRGTTRYLLKCPSCAR